MKAIAYDDRIGPVAGFIGLAIAGWLTLSPASAQEVGTDAPPHLIQDVAAEPAGDGTRLVLHGVFSPERFPNVRVTAREGTLAYSVEIPGAIADPALAPNHPFSTDGPLRRVDISVFANRAEPARGVVTLEVQLGPGTELHFLPAESHAAAMQFAVVSETGADSEAGMRKMGGAPGGEAWQGRSTLVRIAVLNGSGVAGKAGEVGVLLGKLRRRSLENRLGRRVEVVNISNATRFDHEKTTVFHRPGFLREALLIARILPGDQSVSPMKGERLRRTGIDVEILLGRDMP